MAQAQAAAGVVEPTDGAPARVRELLHVAFPDGKADVMDDSAGMHGCMGAWVYGRMGVWVHGCMGAWVYGCMGVWVVCHEPCRYRQHVVTNIATPAVDTRATSTSPQPSHPHPTHISPTFTHISPTSHPHLTHISPTRRHPVMHVPISPCLSVTPELAHEMVQLLPLCQHDAGLRVRREGGPIAGIATHH